MLEAQVNINIPQNAFGTIQQRRTGVISLRFNGSSPGNGTVKEGSKQAGKRSGLRSMIDCGSCSHRIAFQM
ncbi:hypothetical protein BLOT_007063 [Blomia tropicalis]|nr:hypothetical protein BLOT_007063 [Blomia tropicalis]